MAKDLLTEYQKEELKRLSRFTLSPIQRVVVYSILALLGCALFLLILTAPAEQRASLPLLRELEVSDQEWAQQLAADHRNYSDWLNRRGIAIEQGIYARISYRVLAYAQRLDSTGIGGRERTGLGTEISIFLSGALLRASFLALAALRLVLVFVLWGWWASRRRVVPYAGANALGEAGNGRLFFSGVRVSLNELDADGLPRTQVTALASPKRAASAVVNSSEILKVLVRFGADNELNRALASIILAYGEIPDQVAFPSEAGQLSHAYEAGNLRDYVPRILAQVLLSHEGLDQNGGRDRLELLTRSIGTHSSTGTLNGGSYAELLGATYGAILSPRLRAAAQAVSSAEVATLVLALEAGKSLAFGLEGKVWTRKSRFPELAARAVLHSCPELSQTYSAAIRNRVRRAIIYAGESSVFAPLRLPQHLPDETLALRALARLLLCLPHELEVRAAHEELSGLLAHIHLGFEKLFFAAGSELDPELLDEAFLAGNTLFLPLQRVLPILQQAADRVMVERVHELATILHHHRIERDALETSTGEEGPRGGSLTAASHDSVLPPLTEDQVASLASQFRIDSSMVRDWSAYRLALFRHGWLARRVSERTVPATSLVFAVLRETRKAAEAPLSGIEGCVPLRATRCREQWGRQWAQRFIEADWARIAENRRDYERLLAGEITDVGAPDQADDESDEGVAAHSGS